MTCITSDMTANIDFRNIGEYSIIAWRYSSLPVLSQSIHTQLGNVHNLARPYAIGSGIIHFAFRFSSGLSQPETGSIAFVCRRARANINVYALGYAVRVADSVGLTLRL